MPSPCADVGEAERLQDLADGALMVVHPETFEDDLLQIDASPPDDAVLLPIRAGLDDLSEFGQLLPRQPGRMPPRLDIAEAIGSLFVEAVSPVAQCLAIHATDPGRLLAVHTVEHRCQRQKSPALVGVLRGGGEPTQIRSRVVRPKLHRCSHGANPPRAIESAFRTAEKPP